MRFGVLEEDSGTDYYRLKVWGAEEQTYQTIVGILYMGASFYPVPLSVFLENTASVYPDLDLHAFTPDGMHVGIDYETGVYEVEIPSARASGDLYQGTEWITIPDNTEAFFVVSSRDVAEFMTSSAALELENENSLYAIRVTHKDGVGGWYTSSVIAQEIEPGSEVYHDFSVTQNPDGTYSVEAEQGMDLLSLETWQATIDNVPDNVFIGNPAQRKQALKNKFSAIFNMLEANNYNGVVNKLSNDILEKLDADGEGDWVRQPVLAGEVETLIGILSLVN